MKHQAVAPRSLGSPPKLVANIEPRSKERLGLEGAGEMHGGRQLKLFSHQTALAENLQVIWETSGGGQCFALTWCLQVKKDFCSFPCMRGSWPLWQCLCSASRYSKQGSGVLSLWKLPSSILWACFADPGHATHQSQSCLKGSSSVRCGATSPQVPPPLLSGLAYNCGNTDFLQMPSNDPLGIILPINKTNLENRCISYC